MPGCVRYYLAGHTCTPTKVPSEDRPALPASRPRSPYLPRMLVSIWRPAFCSLTSGAGSAESWWKGPKGRVRLTRKARMGAGTRRILRRAQQSNPTPSHSRPSWPCVRVQPWINFEHLHQPYTLFPRYLRRCLSSLVRHLATTPTPFLQQAIHSIFTHPSLSSASTVTTPTITVASSAKLKTKVNHHIVLHRHVLRNGRLSSAPLLTTLLDIFPSSHVNSSQHVQARQHRPSIDEFDQALQGG